MKRILTFLVACWVSLQWAWAQNDMLMPYMYNLPQSTYTNAADQNQFKVTIGLPIISHVGFGARNFFAANDLIRKNRDTTILDLNLLMGKLDRTNYMYFGASYDLFHLGIRVKKTFWMLNVRDRLDMHLSLPGDLLELGWRGNKYFSDRNRTADFSGLGLDATYWREIGLLAQFPLSDKVNMGIRPKLLLGMANASIARNSSSLFTDRENAYALTAKTDYLANISTGPINPDTGFNNFGSQASNFFNNFKNMGFGVDFGLTYSPNERLHLTGAVNNLGFINWRENVRNYTGTSTQTDFRGVPFDAVVANGQFISDRTVLDSVVRPFRPEETRNVYSTQMQAHYLAMVNYDVSEVVRLGASFNAWQFMGLRTAFSANALFRAGRIVHAGLNYNIQNNRYDNLGAGFYIKPGPIQYYIVTDNIFGLVTPWRAQNTNFRMGLNLVFGNSKPADKDGDGVPDKKDECPDEAGPIALKGCPDRDGDGIPDKVDECPDQAGLAQFNGCPDRDGDLVPDKDDACPDVAGLANLRGCPDKDNDGIPDKDDACPDEAGVAYLMGCPDTDGDSVANHLDKCPTVAGSKEHFGCPDTDGDGLYDHEDKCPTEAGPKSNGGCPIGDRDNDGVKDDVDACPDQAGPRENKGCPWPDTDGDGVLDKDDDCPKTPGPASNKGCPELTVKQREVIRKAFSNLEFETAKTSIKAESYPSLNELAQLLVENPQFKLELAGHTDNVGKPQVNLVLSKGRALAVKNYLVGKGVASANITAEGYGQTRPIANNKTPDGRKKNRRVEMKILYD